MLYRKVRRRAIAGRPLPKPPSTTALNQMVLHNCPAYEQIDNIDDDDEMIN